MRINKRRDVDARIGLVTPNFDLNIPMPPIKKSKSITVGDRRMVESSENKGGNKKKSDKYIGV